MRGYGVHVAGLMVVWLGASGVTAQVMKISDAADYSKVMGATSVAVRALRTSLSAAQWAEARESLVKVQQGYMALDAFWMEREKDDAVAIVREALGLLDDLEGLLAIGSPSRADTMAAAKQVQGTCGACHQLYREGDNETGFRFAPGVY